MAYTLILTEKPSAALKLAQALSEDKIEKLRKNDVTSYKIVRGGKNIVIAPAVGHLFVLVQKNGHWTYPVFNVEWEPVFIANKRNMWSKKYYQNIRDLSRGAEEFISATDYDVEGAVIAYNILRYICNVKDAGRMKFSTLTVPDLEEAYENMSEHLDFGQIEAGITRHHLDWLFGINISRALTLSLKVAGGFKTLSTGRVQGPTLDILTKRQREIDVFKPVPFWQLELLGLVKDKEMLFLHKKGKFWEKGEAEGILKKCTGKPLVIEDVKKKEYEQNPPIPFDLTTLQREAYRCFGYSPKHTLDTAQGLYEQALISYPRTSSQKLPAKLGYKTIIKSLAGQKKYAPLCQRLLDKPTLKPNEGKKIDPAHPAIFPTGNIPKDINPYQKKVYDLIVKRFLSVFAEPAIRESINVTGVIEGERFVTEGVRTIEQNWIEFYSPYAKFKEQLLPEIRKGERVDVRKFEMLEKETQPPKRYTQASILKEMETNGLGTKATRAHILQTLYDRGYIKEQAVVVTKLGEMVITALEKYCPEIISVNLTKKFEEDMEAISNGKEKMEVVVESAEKELRKILEKFKKHEGEIGKELLGGVKEVMKEETTIGKCSCGKGDLVIKRSRVGKRFVACTAYPACTETFSLPQNGNLTILSENCEKCGLHIVSVKRFRKRPWKLCVRCGFVVKRKPKKEGPEKELKPKGRILTNGKKMDTKGKAGAPEGKVQPV